MIRTGEHNYHPMPGVSEGRHAESVIRAHWPEGIPFHIPLAVADHSPLLAEVNYSRWVVRCPWCWSAQVACATDRRFLCTTCLNGRIDGKWIEVQWPDEAMRAEIERVLMLRESPANRNWQPGKAFLRPQGWMGPAETIDDLLEENHLQGDRPVVPSVFVIPSGGETH